MADDDRPSLRTLCDRAVACLVGCRDEALARVTGDDELDEQTTWLDFAHLFGRLALKIDESECFDPFRNPR